MKRRPMLLLGLGIVLIFVVLYTTPLPELFLSGDMKEALRLYRTEKPAAVTGKLESEQCREYGNILVLKDVTLDGEEGPLAIGKVRIQTDSGPDRLFQPGWILRVEGSLGAIAGPDNPGEFDAAAYYRVKGIRFRMRKTEVRILQRTTNWPRAFLEQLRDRLLSRIQQLFPQDVSGVLAAMLLGERNDLDEETRSLYQTGGILHVLAISGLHLSMLGMGLFSFLRLCRLSLRAAGILSGAAMILYTFLIGCPVSAVRAVIMFLLLIGAKLTGRTYDPPTGLACAAAVLLITNPSLIFYSGFQMSCCAVLFTTVFSGRGKGASALLLYLWMLPLTAWSYYEIPLLSIPVNLLFVPLLPVILGCGLGALALASLPLPVFFMRPVLTGILHILTGITTLLLRLLQELLSRIQKLPFSSLPTGKPLPVFLCCYLAALLLWSYFYEKMRLLKRRFMLLLFIPLLLLIPGIHPGGMLKMTFLSVGQGDGIFVETPSGIHLLVDGGSSTVYQLGKYTLAPFLKHEGIRRLDYLLVTHTDQDHISGIVELLEMINADSLRLQVGALLLPELIEHGETYSKLEDLAARAGARVLHVQKGDSLMMGEVNVDILGPDPDKETLPLDANAWCVVLRLSCRDFDALLTGDVEGEGEEQLIQSLLEEKKDNGRADGIELLKVAHHGSRGSTPESLLALLNPELSIISCGAGNSYGHPHEELLQRLEAAGSKVLRTDTSGAITVVTDGRRCRVTTFKRE